MMSKDNNMQNDVVFSREVGSIIFKMTEKYNLKENAEELIAKIRNNKPTHGELIRLIVEDIIIGKSHKEDLLSLLQNKLSINQSTAETLAAEINTEIVPLAQKDPNIKKINIVNKPQIPAIPVKKITSEKVEKKEKFAKKTEFQYHESKSGSDKYREEI